MLVFFSFAFESPAIRVQLPNQSLQEIHLRNPQLASSWLRGPQFLNRTPKELQLKDRAITKSVLIIFISKPRLYPRSSQIWNNISEHNHTQESVALTKHYPESHLIHRRVNCCAQSRQKDRSKTLQVRIRSHVVSRIKASAACVSRVYSNNW